MSPSRRLVTEEKVVREHFGATFRIQGEPDAHDFGLVGRLQSNSGRTYTVFIPLEGYPDRCPELLVVEPKLVTAQGKPLADFEWTAEMHLKESTEHGHVSICHSDDTHWSARNSLYRVLLKGRLWLEAYERHLRTGKPIDAFLPHME